jgi:hypothetical protein
MTTKTALAVTLLRIGCSSSETTTTGPGSGPGGSSVDSGKPAPATPADAPVLESFETGIPEKVATNTPLPQGVRCEATSHTDVDIGYACSIYFSKIQTANDIGGYTCGARDAKLETTGAAAQELAVAAAPSTASNFGLAIPKEAFPRFRSVKLDASCRSVSGGIQVTRPHSLEPAH